MNKKRIIMITAAAVLVAAGLAISFYLIISGNRASNHASIPVYMYSVRNAEFKKDEAEIKIEESFENTVGNALNALSEFSVRVDKENPLSAKVESVTADGDTVNISFEKGYLGNDTHRNVAVTYCVIKTVGALSEIYDKPLYVRVDAAGEPVKDETGQVIEALSTQDINITTAEKIFQTEKKSENRKD